MVIGLIGRSPRMVEEHISQVLAAAEGFHTWCLRGPDLSLRDGLKALHDQLPDAVISCLGLDVEHCAGWAVWARNHVDHGGAKQHREISDFFALNSVADSVQVVTYLVALQQFGISEVKMVRAMTVNGQIAALVERSHAIATLPANP